MGRGVAPGLEPALRGSQRQVQVFALGVGDLADLLAGGGVHDIDARAAFRFAPLVVDQKKGIGVIGHGVSVGAGG
ncbi:hypothetical protein D3C87_1946610 [compost metagenome]